MSPFERLFFLELSECADGLRVVIIVASPQGPIVEPLGAGIQAQEIRPMPGRQAIELIWRDYVGFTVLNESYALPEPGSTTTHDGLLREYETSHARTYIERTTWARDEHPGPLKHWEICTSDRIVSVIGHEEPSVTEIPMNPDWLTLFGGREFVRR